jgi:uncharacterized protein YbjT (DUF2867 family)
MAAGKGFAERDKRAARNFAAAAKSAGVERVIYLGGLGEQGTNLSVHLQSRQEVGRILSGSGVSVTEFRAGIIIGAGSLSFEMIRYLTERVPLMICPRWVFTRAQPIGINDVLRYLTEALENETSIGRVIEIGGKDVLSYGDLMLLYAHQRGLKRWIVRVPVLTTKLSSYWVHLVTPIPSSMATPLIQGLKNEVVTRTDDAKRIFPDIRPEGYKIAIARALEKLHPQQLSPLRKMKRPGRFHLPKLCRHTEGMIVESRQVESRAEPNAIFEVLENIGGQNGWWGLEHVWRLRGIMDRLWSGEGYVSYRTRKKGVEAGDRIDFLDVETVIDKKELLFRVRFKLPGQGWMRLQVGPDGNRKGCLSMTVFFAPKGLLGLIYWYSLLPFHRIMFRFLMSRIIREAEKV